MVNITRSLEQQRPGGEDQMVCSKTHEDRHVIYTKPPTNRIPLRSRGRNPDQRANTVHTQTPTNELSYEFDRAFHNFKENVRRTVPTMQTAQQRQHLRVYLPTIIDTKPKSRRSRSRADPTLTKMLSCAQRGPPNPSRPPCTCNHRAAPRAETKQPEDDIIKTKPVSVSREYNMTPRDNTTRSDQYDNHITPVLAVAIRRNPQDKDPIVQFNGVAGHDHTRISFTPFVSHISTQTSKSYVHVEFEIPDEI